MPADYNGVVCGLCGNFNGLLEDDFLTPSGVLAPSADQFGTEWMVEDDMSYDCGGGDIPGYCQDESTTLISQALCEIIRDSQGPFSFCHGSVDPQAYFNNCVFDVCISENSNDVLCHSVQAYVSACQSANTVVYPWREIASCGKYVKYVKIPTIDEFVFFIQDVFPFYFKNLILHILLIAFYKYILLLHFQSWTAPQTSQTAIMRCVARTVAIHVPAALMLAVNTHAQKVVSVMRDL